MSKLTKWMSMQQLHHRMMLVLALPMLIWIISGSYFVWMDLGYIRGDHYRQQPLQLNSIQLNYPLAKVLAQHPNADQVELVTVAQHPFYLVTTDRPLLIDAINGKVLPQLSALQAQTVAQANMPSDATVTTVTAIQQDPPAELSARHLPVWQVSFDDAVSSTLYVSMQSGEVVSRRHHFWRLFDWFWRFHIMDYDDGVDIDNALLLTTSIFSIVAVLAGIWLQLKRLQRGRI
ncbi:peptidase [Ferrimonas lipolytica]|uniref:Peptidase n=1 Tax=Ferrimonas lipolytica TaxID=2724191 RepID=A0A6H1UF67_9GAMM|nr:peptidase [Ferrimonas lipolytica]QIZ77279.1 peptidase [Ferrimonas lipolytica]